MKQKTKVISGFPGVGKSTFFRNALGELKVSDSDSSYFSWVHTNGDRVRNPDFPKNYINHIKKLIDEGYDIIFVSTHREVIDALVANNIEFQIVYPDRSLKEEYLRRYTERGSDANFIKLLDDKWDAFIDDVEAGSNVAKTRLMTPSEGIDSILSDWTGDTLEGEL